MKSDTICMKFNFSVLKKNRKPADAGSQIQFLETSWEDDVITKDTTLVRISLSKGHFLTALNLLMDIKVKEDSYSFTHSGPQPSSPG